MYALGVAGVGTGGSTSFAGKESLAGRPPLYLLAGVYGEEKGIHREGDINDAGTGPERAYIRARAGLQTIRTTTAG